MHMLFILSLLLPLAHLGLAMPYYPRSYSAPSNSSLTKTWSSAVTSTATDAPMASSQFCQFNYQATELETNNNFFRYGNAFIVDKDLTKAFTYVAPGFINHHPGVGNGAEVALQGISAIWPTTTINVLRIGFKGNMGWLNYLMNGTIQVVDRYRWENGCIVEHWDAGEVFPDSRLFEAPPN